MRIDTALTVAGFGLVLAGTCFYVAALVAGMAFDFDVGADDALYVALAGVAGGVGLGLAGAIGAALVGAIVAAAGDDR